MHSDTTPCHVGDRELTSVTVALQKPKRQPVVQTFPQFKNYSHELFWGLLKSETHNLNKIFTTDDADKQIRVFNEDFMLVQLSWQKK